jgi:hypothetical protein
MSQIQNLKQNPFGHSRLGFGACLEFVICDLEFKATKIVSTVESRLWFLGR